MDVARHNYRTRLEGADGGSAQAVGGAISRVAVWKTSLRSVDRRQGPICPVIVPPDQYYVHRDGAELDGDYWEPREDPDGRIRDRNCDEEREQYLDDVAEEIQFVCGLPPGKILDVGCGLGWFLHAVEWPAPEASDRKWVIAGTEISNVARLSADAAGVRVYWLLAEVPTDSWDVIRCHHVIEHMERPILELDEMHRLLKPGGWLLMSTPDFGGPCAEHFGDRYRMLHDPTHCSLFTNESMHRFLRDGGFSIERVTYPFPRRYATHENMERWYQHDGVSPPWPGNWMTFYARKA